ncbi:MAG: hypothetical protein F6K58_31005 [Symploca sp. SIO2E9]|nr:hypothetical protein [Symploca sp. SIO2E9]
MSRDALVVGINTYKYEDLPHLQAPAEDAEAIAKLLERHGDFKVWRLPEAINPDGGSSYVGKEIQVTLNQLKKALVQLLKPEGKNIPDTALLYFSGHGLRTTLGISEGFLATSDVYPDVGFNGLSLQWLRKLLQESPIKQQIIWLDCCHSGELLNMSEADPGEQGQARDRCFITASREFEPAYEDISEPYSILTKSLLEGLDPSKYPQRWVTNYSLVDYLNQDLLGVPQRPTFTNFGEPINLTRTWEVLAAKSTSETSSAICPYKSLEFFDCNEEDPKYFFGREKLTDQLIDRVRQGNFLAILGASGSGKSSVLRAGLLHQLKLGQRLGGSQQWQFHLMLPGQHPLQSLAQAFLDPKLSSLERAEQLGRAEGLLREGADGLRRLVQSSDAPRVVLVVDQFEEVFTLCQEKTERQNFISCLLGAGEKVTDKFCLIIAMRADFFGKCVEENYSGLAKKIQENLITVTPMNQGELRRAITLPAQRVKLEIEPELVEQMLLDVEGSPGSLPLLQDTLTQLWKTRSDKGLELATYTQSGGMAGTLDQRANKVYEELSPQQQEAAKHIFLCLTQLGEGTEDTRRRVLKTDLITSVHPEALIEGVVQKLADEKLVVTSSLTGKGTETQLLAVVDVPHEALIRHWSLLRKWLAESREHLREKRKIELASEEWRNHKRGKDYLLQGKRLREAREFQKEQAEGFPLSNLAEEFVRASRKQRRLSLLKMSSWLVIPVFILLAIVEPILRRGTTGRYIDVVMEKGEDQKTGIKRKVEYLVAGCDQKEKKIMPKPLRDFVFGSCIPLTKAKLKKTDLFGADLSGAHLSGADFREANLLGANLSGANLLGAKLSPSALFGANLSGANLIGADLSGADLSIADLSGADFSNTNLRGAKFRGAKLSGANLSGADLSGADFGKPILLDEALSGVDLSDKEILGADLSDEEFSGADLSDSNFSFADLSGADLENITWDEYTKWDNVRGLEEAINVPEALKQQLLAEE